MFESEIVELTGPTNDEPPHLNVATNDRFVATATAVRSGAARVEARVVHRKTIALLVLRASVEVLATPAAPAGARHQE
jgi:hypothetical protein